MPSALELKLLSMFHNPFRLNVYANGTSSFTSGNEILVPYDTVVNDPNSNFNVGTHLYTCPIDGWYDINCAIAFSTSAATSVMYITIQQNAVDVRRGPNTNTTVANPGNAVDAILKCVAGDTLGAVARQTSGGAVNNVTGPTITYMDIAWLGPS